MKIIDGESVITKKIISLLDSNKVDYQLVTHAPVFTSEEAAEIRKTDKSNGAKALVLVGDNIPKLFVIPGDKKVDFKKIKSYLSIKDLRFATPEEVETISGLTIGSIPPVGSAMNLTSYFDSEILNKERIAFNAGSHTVSIEMAAKDLVSIAHPGIFTFAK